MSRTAWTLALAVVLGLSTGAVAQTLPFEGKWATELGNCGLAANEGQRRAPIILSAKRLFLPGLMTCDFTSVLPGGVSYRAEAVCYALGQYGRDFFTFAVLDGRLYWTWDDKTGIFDRCPD